MKKKKQEKKKKEDGNEKRKLPTYTGLVATLYVAPSPTPGNAKSTSKFCEYQKIQDASHAGCQIGVVSDAAKFVLPLLVSRLEKRHSQSKKL